MRIIRSLDELGSPILRPVVTIGNFDGVHLGHREIFRRVVRLAREQEGTSVVLTFVPHPRKLLDPQNAPPQINTHEEKERLIAASCIDVLICLPFTREMAATSAERFVREVLVDRIGVHHLVVGYDYAFGRKREGDTEFLRARGEEFGFTVESLSPVTQGGEIYSSTRIREMILAGEVEEVVEFLGRHFTLEGTVVHGAKRGGKLGFPTANLRTEKELLPRPGVYAVKAKWRESVFDAVMNIGCNPTFCQGGLSVEVHLLGFTGDLYGESVRLYFVERLREEKRFPNAEALVRQVDEDIRRSREVLQRARIIEYREYLDCGFAQGKGTP